MEDTDAKIVLLEQRVAEQGKLLQEVRDSQLKIANALLGNLDSKSVGLIEESRTQRQQIDALQLTANAHALQISELQIFKSDIKRVVAAIAFLIPITFEILKGVFIMAWEFVKAQ